MRKLMTTAEVAEKYGVAGQTVRMWARRRRDPLPTDPSSPRDPVTGRQLQFVFDPEVVAAWHRRYVPGRRVAPSRSRVEVRHG